MCLDYIDPIPRVLKKEHGEYVGWKIYREPHGPHDSLAPQFEGYSQPIGIWINERKYRTVSKINKIAAGQEEGRQYRTGFHIYLSETEAYSKVHSGAEIVRKVYFRNPVAYGSQGLRIVIVAKNLRILKKRDKKKEIF